MNLPDLSDLSVEELKERVIGIKKSIKTSFILLLIMLGACAYLAITRSQLIYLCIPLAFIGMLYISNRNLKNIESELKRRNSNIDVE